jgi:hypothetical protein
MPTGARVRKSVDVGRIGKAVSQPGIDPRTWTTVGRVDDDPQAVRWVVGIGWIADVSFTGGPLDGETEVPCRVAGNISGSMNGDYAPLPPGCAVIVVLPGGNAEESPIIVGKLSNRKGCEAPLTVNNLPITAGSVAAPSTPVTVSPFDTEIHVSEYNRREQYSGDRFTQANTQTIKANQPLAGVLLGSELAAFSMVLGEPFINALIAQLQLVILTYTYINTAGTPTPIAPTPVATDLAWQTATTALTATLSQKIKGE